jgi:hypothetical protein
VCKLKNFCFATQLETIYLEEALKWQLRKHSFMSINPDCLFGIKILPGQGSNAEVI